MADLTDQRRQDGLVYVSIAMTTISVVAVLVRSVVRFILIRNPGMDDYTILVSVTFTIGYMIEILLSKENRIGFPISTLTLDNTRNFVRIALAVQVTYYIIVGSIKISILYLYLRLAVTPRFRMLSHATIIFQLIFTLICICITFGQCTPFKKTFDLAGSEPGSCINTTAFFYFTSGMNIVTDIWILALPVKTLGLLNRSIKERIALAVIFGAGIFAVMMSVVRLRSIYLYTLSPDPTRDAIALNLWSTLEVNTAIVCASVPALKPLFTWKRIQEFRSPNRFAGNVSNPLEYKQNKQNKVRRKGSDASLYTDLEAFDLSQVSASPSPVGGLPTRPPSSYRSERSKEFEAKTHEVHLHAM